MKRMVERKKSRNMCSFETQTTFFEHTSAGFKQECKTMRRNTMVDQCLTHFKPLEGKKMSPISHPSTALTPQDTETFPFQIITHCCLTATVLGSIPRSVMEFVCSPCVCVSSLSYENVSVCGCFYTSDPAFRPMPPGIDCTPPSTLHT